MHLSTIPIWAYPVFSMAARTMPAPLAGGSRLYLWLHDFLQAVAINWDKLGARQEAK